MELRTHENQTKFVFNFKSGLIKKGAYLSIKNILANIMANILSLWLVNCCGIIALQFKYRKCYQKSNGNKY